MRRLAFLLVPLLLYACEQEPTTPAGSPSLGRASVAADLGQPGPYVVGFTMFMIEDGARDGRSIPIYVWYPVDPGTVDQDTPEAEYSLDPFFDTFPLVPSSAFEMYGLEGAYQEPAPSMDAPFPLVMFSPGWGAAAWDHVNVGVRLASHGVVVAIVTHYGDGTTGTASEPSDPLGVATMNRPLDVKVALTAVLERNATGGDLLAGVVDPTTIIASGWSLGGYAGMALTGGDDLVCESPAWAPDDFPGTCVPITPDPRFTALITLDGSNQVLFFDELSRIKVPWLIMGQEWTTAGSWVARAHSASTAHPSYRAEVFATNHQSFSSLCVTIPQGWTVQGVSEEWAAWWVSMRCVTPWTEPADMYSVVPKYMLAFIKGYQDMLTPGYALSSEPLIEFFVTEKRSPNSIDDDWPDDFWFFMHQPGSNQARAAKNPNAVPAIQHMGRHDGPPMP